MLKKHPHTPVHLFLDNTLYFITGAIYEKRLLLKSTEIKGLFLRQMTDYFRKYDWQLHHWVILDNHYHLMGKSKLGEDLSRIVQGIHGATSASIREATGADTPIWWNYWDYCPRNEHDYYVRVNYLLWNPIKHGYVERVEHYPFSSYHQLVDAKGHAAIELQFRRFPEYEDVSYEKPKTMTFKQECQTLV
ncbi:MAG TPA: transposase [bacterium]